MPLEILELMKTMDERFEFHRNNTEVSIDKYHKEKIVTIGLELNKLKKIYLDTRYWIFLRDASLDKPAKDIHLDIYNTLKKLVKDGIAVCPISETILLELLKNNDKEARLAGAKIIDELSKGYAFQPYDARSCTELNYLLYKYPENDYSMHNIEELVWTKVAYTLGFAHPVIDYISEAENIVFSKVFIDLMWSVSLSKIVSYENFDISSLINAKNNLFEMYNRVKRYEKNEKLNYKNAFLLELATILHYFEPAMLEMIAHKYEAETGSEITEEERNDITFAKNFSNIIYQAFKENKIVTDFPTVGIPARIFAVFRQDGRRLYKQNDIYDIDHATTALAYCDIFLTEKPLTHLLTTNPLKLDEMFSTTVMFEEKAVLKRLEFLL